MIPIRMGSKRVKNKNIRLLNNKPLLEYIIESTINSKIFDEIYLNSESESIKKYADKYNIKFYKRPPNLAQDNSSNDDFMYDFLKNIKCDIVIQLLATSPFITSNEIINFTKNMIQKKYDTLISVHNIQIECVYKNQAINFNKKKFTPPSQELEPIKAYACGIMGWKSEDFTKNMVKYNAAYHGGDGNIGYYSLEGFSTIDIDYENDFKLAEIIAKYLNNN